MKRLLAAFITMIVTATMLVTPVGAAEKEITVTIDGVSVAWTDAKPYVDENGQTMIPLQTVAKALGLEFKWDKDNKAALFIRRYAKAENPEVAAKCVVFYSGTNQYYTWLLLDEGTRSRNAAFSTNYWAPQHLSGIEDLTMDSKTVLKDGKVYGSVYNLTHHLDYDAIWDEKTKTINIVEAQDVSYQYTYKTNAWIAFKDVKGIKSIKVTGVTARVFDDNTMKVTSTKALKFTKMTNEVLAKVNAANSGKHVYGVEYSNNGGNAQGHIVVSVRFTKTNGTVFTEKITLS